MNRAARLEDQRRNTVGFALEVLQRRLASVRVTSFMDGFAAIPGIEVLPMCSIRNASPTFLDSSILGRLWVVSIGVELDLPACHG